MHEGGLTDHKPQGVKKAAKPKSMFQQTMAASDVPEVPLWDKKQRIDCASNGFVQAPRDESNFLQRWCFSHGHNENHSIKGCPRLAKAFRVRPNPTYHFGDEPVLLSDVDKSAESGHESELVASDDEHVESEHNCEVVEDPKMAARKASASNFRKSAKSKPEKSKSKSHKSKASEKHLCLLIASFNRCWSWTLLTSSVFVS